MDAIRNNLLVLDEKMLDKETVKPLTVAEFSQLDEQTLYLRGVLFADKECRTLNRRAGDVLGDLESYADERDFWRGFFETSGTIHMPSEPEAKPRIRICAAREIMLRFRKFLKDELDKPCGFVMNGKIQMNEFDKNETLARGECTPDSRKAQIIVRVLYHGCTVSRDSYKRTADAIMQWKG